MSRAARDTFARRTALVAIGQTAVKTSQLVLAVVLVRMLSPAEWSQAAFLLSVYLVATTVGTLNLQQGILFFMPRVGPAARRALVVQNVVMLAALGVLIGGALALAEPLLSGGRLGHASRLPLLGLAVALELPVAVTQVTMIAVRRFTWSALWDVGGTIVLIVATVVPVALGGGVDGVVRGLVIAAAIRLAGSLVLLARVVPGPAGGLGRRFLTRQLLFALPLGVTLGVSILNRAVDKWFVAAFRPGDFGVYAVAAQEIPVLAVVPYAGGAALVAALVDAFHHDDVHVARTHWVHLTLTMSVVVVPMSMALVLVAPEVMSGLFTDEFASGVLPFQLFTLITIHRVAEYGMVLRAAGRTRDLLRIATATLAANAVLAGTGAYAAGMVGASLGTLIASAVGWGLALRRIAAVLQVPVRLAFAWRAWLSSVAIAAGAAGSAWLAATGVGHMAGVGIAGRMALKLAVFGTAYLGGLWAWRRTPGSRTPDTMVLPICPTQWNRDPVLPGPVRRPVPESAVA